MSVDLPLSPNLIYPRFRVQHATSWRGAATNWVELPMQRDESGNGFLVKSWHLAVLPDEGEAVLYFFYGRMNGKDFSVSGLPDLRSHEIRIIKQISDEGWATCWWGTCEARLDHPMPGAARPMGMVEYHCKDALHRTSRWPIDRHQFVGRDGVTYGATVGAPGAIGHPGFNVRQGARTIGNRYTGSPSFDAGYDAHTWPGGADSAAWTDRQALQQAIISSTPAARVGDEILYSQPVFTPTGALDLLDTVSWWDVPEGMRLRDLLVRIGDRRRGRGGMMLGWSEPDGADGQLVPELQVRCQTLAGLSAVPLPSGATFTVPGAEDEDTAIDVDLIGDHRLGPASLFEIAEVGETLYGAVAFYGAPIRVVVPLSTVDGSAEPRWVDDEAAAFDAASTAERQAGVTKYHHVYRTIGLPMKWTFTVGRGAADTADGTPLRSDYRFDTSLGAGDVPTLFLDLPDVSDEKDTSPGLLSLTDDLPLYAGMNYGVDPPVRYAATYAGQDDALPLQVYRRVADGYFVPLESETNFGCQRSGSEGRIDLTFTTDEAARRLFKLYDPDELVLTVAIDLPHRLGMTSISDARLSVTDDKVKRIYAKDFAVHLAHPYAILSLDETDESDGGYAPIRAAGPGPLYLRDDRDLLAQRFHLACLWYMTPSQTATWSRLDGGPGSWTDAAGGEHPFEQLGEVVDQLAHNGGSVQLNTMITRVGYAAGRFHWMTSWHDREWA